jgi:hypothetical protein
VGPRKKSNRGSFPLSSVTHTHTPVHRAPHPAPQGRPPTRGSPSRGEYAPWALLYRKQGEPWVTGGLVANVVGSTEFAMAPCKFLEARVCYYEGERGLPRAGFGMSMDRAPVGPLKARGDG